MAKADDTHRELITLEKRFWQSMVDQDAATAVGLLDDSALMVSQHGAMRFDHDGYRRMAEQGTMVLKAFELRDIQVLMPREDTAILTYRADQEVAKRGAEQTESQTMLDSSTWVRKQDRWRCVAHTETPARA